MTNRPSVPEIITVNSEVLQSQIRDLLPSQNGFGSELQATNIITPIIDLTRAAEGTGLPEYLQNAINFGGATAFRTVNTTDTLANTPGFYRVVGTSTVSGSVVNAFDMDDGSTTKRVWGQEGQSSAVTTTNLDLFFWLPAGVTLSAVSTAVTCNITGSIRQVADSLATLTNPSGYPL